jgi:hypothetical protein
MAENNLHLRMTETFDSSVSVPIDEVDDAFSEWDESAPTAQLARGSQSSALPATSRTTTLSDPRTPRRLAKGSQRIAIPRHVAVPQTLEEALLALLSETDRSDR